MKYERLTERVGKGISIKETSTNDNKSIWNAIVRLAELEDKIERGELVDVKENHLILISRGSGKSFKQLEAIEILTKYKNGTLIELPCKVGDTVWEIIQSPNGNFISKEIISDYWITEDGIVARTGLYTTDRIEIEEFGKTVFLTEEIAKQKLKELEK